MIDTFENPVKAHPIFNSDEIDLEEHLYQRRQILNDFIVDLIIRTRITYCSLGNPHSSEKITREELVEEVHGLSKSIENQSDVPYVQENGTETTLAGIVFAGHETVDIFDGEYPGYSHGMIYDSEREGEALAVIHNLLIESLENGYIDGNTMAFAVDYPLSEEISMDYGDFLYSYGVSDLYLGQDYSDDPKAGEFHKIGGTVDYEDSRMETPCETCEEEKNDN